MGLEPASEIYFRCTACRRRLAIGRGGIGHLVECPGCGSSLQVPPRSTAWSPALWRMVVVLAVTAVGLAALTGAGWTLWHGRARAAPVTTAGLPRAEPRAAATRAAERAPSVRDAAAASAELVHALERQNKDLATQHRAVLKQYDELANWVLNNLRGRYPLKDRFVSRLRFAPVTQAYTVNPDLLEFLEADEREASLLNDAFLYGRATLDTLEANHLVATQTAPDRVTLHIPPYEQDGSAMRDDLYDALEAALGKARFNRLMDVAEEEMRKSYHYFGAAARTMIFQIALDEGSSDPYLVIKEGWVIPTGPGTRAIEATESAVRELPATYNSYLAWLPDFVTHFARKTN